MRYKFPAALAIAIMALCAGVSIVNASETIAYSYDAKGRLVQVHHSGDINDNLTIIYMLDVADNRISVVVNGASHRVVIVLLSGYKVFRFPNLLNNKKGLFS